MITILGGAKYNKNDNNTKGGSNTIIMRTLRREAK